MSDEKKDQQIAVMQPSRLPWNPAFTERYGIEPAAWKALVEAVFPAAQTADSVALALSYCKARRLDPFKRVVHIVPVWDADQGRMVETVWPGIAEHRTTAMRTGLYAGADAATYGDEIEREFVGNTRKGQVKAKVRFPKFCQVTVYRLAGTQRVPVPGPRVYWEETFSQIGTSGVPNQRWQRAPFQMIEKCAEAAALRRAFPEELGDESTDDENRFTIDHETKPLYGRADDPEPVRQETASVSEAVPCYVIVDADGENREYTTAAGAAQAISLVFKDAARRGASHLQAAVENNTHALKEMRQDGHDALVDGLAAEFSDLQKASSPFGAPKTTTEQPSVEDRPERDAAGNRGADDGGAPEPDPGAGAEPRRALGNPPEGPNAFAAADEQDGVGGRTVGSIPATGASDLLGGQPAENLTVPLSRNPGIGDLEYWTRQMLTMIEEKPGDVQRLARIKKDNDNAIRTLKAKAPALYDEVMAAIQAARIPKAEAT